METVMQHMTKGLQEEKFVSKSDNFEAHVETAG
jgi:hypothetical protein